MWVMAVMTMVVTAGGVRRNYRTNQDDECYSSKKKCAQLHVVTPFQPQPFSRTVCTLDAAYRAARSFAPGIFPAVFQP
jgi:hypothetical protein